MNNGGTSLWLLVANVKITVMSIVTCKIVTAASVQVNCLVLENGTTDEHSLRNSWRQWLAHVGKQRRHLMPKAVATHDKCGQ